MDDVARYNKDRWEALAQAGVAYSRPYLDLTPESARQVVDAQGLLGQVRRKDVLGLASGGGQQSAAFGLLGGAQVTVLDLAEAQLQRDREAAAHYGLQMRIEQGDMRELSRFAPASFDVVWHAYSINFVPDPRPAFRTLSTIINILIAQGLVILGLGEELGPDAEAAPGTWEHFKRVAPPWLTVWARLEG